MINLDRTGEPTRTGTGGLQFTSTKPNKKKSFVHLTFYFEIMQQLDHTHIIQEAWQKYDNSRPIQSVTDISAKVSTNHVYRVKLEGDEDMVIAKLSFFGKYEYFQKDHAIINALANNLPAPFQNFLARSLMKSNEVYTFRYTSDHKDVWVVFYNPIEIAKKPPRRFSNEQITAIARELAGFHKACNKVKGVLPSYSKTLHMDIDLLLEILDTEQGQLNYHSHVDIIKIQCEQFLEETQKLNYANFTKMPVFIDWNIGNFSVTKDFKLFSRWDYDWFRMSSRVMDFYFFSRIVSDIGDRTVFSYLISPLMEERFLLFLKSYHAVYPLEEKEIRFIKEAYRFFILHYVINFGRYFFHEKYAGKLQKEAYEIYFPALDEVFDAEKILKALNL